MWEDARLVGRSNSGILELKQNDGSWNKVCADEYWTLQVAGVVCRHVGFDRQTKIRSRVKNIKSIKDILMFKNSYKELLHFFGYFTLFLNFSDNTTERTLVF